MVPTAAFPPNKLWAARFREKAFCKSVRCSSELRNFAATAMDSDLDRIFCDKQNANTEYHVENRSYLSDEVE
jgi:hypothetical protein